MQIKRYRKGFTLLEMMAVIVIMAILAMIALPSYQRYVSKARLEEGRAMLNQTYLWLDKMYNKNSAYKMTKNGAFITNADLPPNKNSGGNTTSYTFSIKKTCASDADNNSDSATFCLIATPDANQLASAGGGKECGTLMVNQAGQFKIQVTKSDGSQEILSTPKHGGVTCF